MPYAGAVLVFDTRVARQLRGAAFNERRAECERALAVLRETRPGLRSLAAATPEMIEAARLPAPLDRRARHVTTETRRVGRVVAALERGEALPGGELLASHESLRRDFECSCAELDWFVDRVMREPGVTGARLTGAGWGGCAIAVGERAALEAGGVGEEPGVRRALRALVAVVDRAGIGRRVRRCYFPDTVGGFTGLYERLAEKYCYAPMVGWERGASPPLLHVNVSLARFLSRWPPWGGPSSREGGRR